MLLFLILFDKKSGLSGLMPHKPRKDTTFLPFNLQLNIL